MPGLFPRVLPFLALLALFAGSPGWLDLSPRPDEGLTFTIVADGMIIEPG